MGNLKLEANAGEPGYILDFYIREKLDTYYLIKYCRDELKHLSKTERVCLIYCPNFDT